MLRFVIFLLWAGAAACSSAQTEAADEAAPHAEDSPSRLSDKAIGLQIDDVPARPRPLVEIGEPFLGTGPMAEGFELPGGAVWRPQLIVYGNARTAIQSFDNGTDTIAEWASRLDLFANLQLSGTERISLGLRPLDNDTKFTSYVFRPEKGDTVGDLDHGWQDPLNINISTLFFEGDVGEMFPRLDDADRLPLDIGFSVGRQPLIFQDGIFLNDIIDSVGVTRNTLRPDGFSNLRITGLFGWNEIDRGDNLPDDGGSLVGLFTEMDVPKLTLNFDSAWVEGDPDTGDALFFALSGIGRAGPINYVLRSMTSIPLEHETSATGRGTLLFAESSLTLHGSQDLVYANAFWAIDRFSSVARDPNTGGPLGRTGILFEAVGLGSYGSPLSNQTDSAFGGSIGAQFLFDEARRQLIVEAGGRLDTNEIDAGALAIGARLQQAFGQNFLLQGSTFVSGQENRAGAIGGRVEFQIKF